MRKSIRPSSMIPPEKGIRPVKLADFPKHISQLTEATTKQLTEVWALAGYEDVEVQGILGEILSKVSALLDLELTAEKKILDHAKAQLESQCNEYRSIAARLGRNVGGSVVPDELNYSDKLSRMENLLGSITVDLNERKKAFDSEINEINRLSKDMDLDPLPDSETEAELSDNRLQQLRDLKKDLSSKRIHRLEELIATSQSCYEVMVDLMYPMGGGTSLTKDKELEEAVVSHHVSGTWSLELRPGLYKAMQSMHQKLVKERERRRDELAMTGAEIARLWMLLRIPSADREAFQSSFEMNLSMDTLNKGYAELTRLKNVRSQCLHQVIQTIRTDILVLWDELGVQSDEQKAVEFPAYFDPLDTLEDVSVELHENYFLSLKARVEELRPLLQRMARREVVVQERLELEALQMNPERLAARGPNAREDRKREEGMNNRVKGLEKMTKELVAAVLAWEERGGGGGPLLFEGERFLDRVRRQEDEYVETRDSLRSSRRKKSEAGRPDLPMAPASVSKTLPGRKVSTLAPGGPAPLKHSLHSHPPLAPSAYLASGTPGRAGLSGQSAGMHGDWENSSLGANARVGQGHGLLGLRDSDCTQYTSSTEVRDRESGLTIVREEDSS